VAILLAFRDLFRAVADDAATAAAKVEKSPVADSPQTLDMTAFQNTQMTQLFFTHDIWDISRHFSLILSKKSPFPCILFPFYRRDLCLIFRSKLI